MYGAKTLAYPAGITSIPYASFLEIERWEYSDAMKQVATNQNDALGAIENATGQTKKVLDAVTGSIDNIYGTPDNLNNKIFANAKVTPPSAENFFTNDVKMDHLAVKLPGENTTTTMGALKNDKEYKQTLNAKGLNASKCFLPMPNEFSYQYGADWNNKFKLGTLALLADNELTAAATILGSGLIMGGAAATINALNSTSGIQDAKKNDKNNGVNLVTDFIKKGAQFGVNPFGVNSEFSPKNIVGLAGLAPNENAIQMFQSMDMREFEFTFELASRKSSESETITSIIEWFKRGMHPTTKNGRGSAVLLQFPDVWRITPKFVPATDDGTTAKPQKSIQHPMMPKTKLCALTFLEVNTTPMGSLATVFDGTIPLVQVTVRFKEITALTRMDMEGSVKVSGDYKPGKNGEAGTTVLPLDDRTKARFVRAGGLDNFPKVSY